MGLGTGDFSSSFSRRRLGSVPELRGTDEGRLDEAAAADAACSKPLNILAIPPLDFPESIDSDFVIVDVDPLGGRRGRVALPLARDAIGGARLFPLECDDPGTDELPPLSFDDVSADGFSFSM